MTNSGEVPSFDRSVGDEVILSMFSDALGREVTAVDQLTADEELTAGAEVRGCLDTVSKQMRRMREGKEVDIGLLMDTKHNLRYWKFGENIEIRRFIF